MHLSFLLLLLLPFRERQGKTGGGRGYAHPEVKTQGPSGGRLTRGPLARGALSPVLRFLTVTGGGIDVKAPPLDQTPFSLLAIHHTKDRSLPLSCYTAVVFYMHHHSCGYCVSIKSGYSHHSEFSTGARVYFIFFERYFRVKVSFLNSLLDITCNFTKCLKR